MRVTNLKIKFQPPSQPLSRVIMVTGKGGVGKTTLASGFAVKAFREGREVGFIEFGDGESGARALGDYRKKVEHFAIHPDHAVTRAATPMLGSPLLAKMVLGNFAMRRLLRAAPGLRELALLESVRLIAESRPNALLVVDMPATGHGLAWLRVPAQVDAITSPGPFKNLVRRIGEDLVAPGKSSVVVVTLPEPMVLQETVELCESLVSEVGLEVARLYVNQVPDAPSQAALHDAIKLEGEEAPVGPAARLLREVLEARQQARILAMQEIVEVLKSDSLKPLPLPAGIVDPSPDQVADWLAKEALS